MPALLDWGVMATEFAEGSAATMVGAARTALPMVAMAGTNSAEPWWRIRGPALFVGVLGVVACVAERSGC